MPVTRSWLPWAAASLAAVPAVAQPSAAEMIGPSSVSTPEDEFGGEETGDRSTLFFTRSIPRSYAYFICISRRAPDGSWAPATVAPFSGTWRDSDPILSLDGSRLYFVSDRPLGAVPKHDFDVWYVKRNGARRMSRPRRLAGSVNGPGNEYFVSEAADGTLYFTSERSGNLGSVDVWFARRGADGTYGTPQNAGPSINAKGIVNLEVLIAPDQSFMIVGSFGRETEPGDSNLYVSFRRDGRWLPPRPLSDRINTSAREYSPRFSADGSSLVFTSERGIPTEQRRRAWTYAAIAQRSAGILNGLGNLYRVSLASEGLPNVEPRRDARSGQ